MNFVFWSSLVGVLYTYIGYPAGIGLLARLSPRPWKSAPITPSVSVVLHGWLRKLLRPNVRLSGNATSTRN